MKKLCVLSLMIISLIVAGCKSSNIANNTGSTPPPELSTKVTAEIDQPALTTTPTLTATSILVVASQDAETVLVNTGFIHQAEKDGVDTCRVVGCKVYESISDGIIAWTYPDGSLLLSLSADEKYNLATQELTRTKVIAQLFGENVNSWISEHIVASISTRQEGNVDEYKIAIQYVEGFKVTMLTIVPPNASK